MSRKKVFFVCSAIDKNKNLLSKAIEAESNKDAEILFEKDCGLSPQTVLGPFFKKKELPIKQTSSINFQNSSRKAIYDGWFVNAFDIDDKKDFMFVIYLNTVNNEKKQRKNGVCIVPTSELKFI